MVNNYYLIFVCNGKTFFGEYREAYIYSLDFAKHLIFDVKLCLILYDMAHEDSTESTNQLLVGIRCDNTALLQTLHRAT